MRKKKCFSLVGVSHRQLGAPLRNEAALEHFGKAAVARNVRRKVKLRVGKVDAAARLLLLLLRARLVARGFHAALFGTVLD